MKIKVILYIIFFSINSFAQTTSEDINQNDPKLNYKYEKGRFLVYDCFDKHFVCTQSLEYNRCKDARVKAIKDGEEHLPCAYFDPSQSISECQKKQQSLTNKGENYLFCNKPKL